MIQKDTCTPVLLQPVSSSQDMEQPTCPLTDEWIKKMWHIYTMGYYSAIKNNEIMLFAATWMDVESVILSEVSQTGKEKYDMTSLIWNLKRNDTNKLTYKT